MASSGATVERAGRAIEHGRANERTALAWNRSALSIAATGGLVAKAALDEGSAWVGVLAMGLLLAVAGAVAAYAVVLRRRGPVLPPRLAMLLISVASVGAGGIACLVVLLA